MGCGCSDTNANCGMNLYLQNGTGAPITLQNVAFWSVAPCVLHVVSPGSSPQLVAWAYQWDGAGTISFNMPDGEVLNIAYTGGDLGDIDANFSPASITYSSGKFVYQDGLLITVATQNSGGPR